MLSFFIDDVLDCIIVGIHSFIDTYDVFGNRLNIPASVAFGAVILNTPKIRGRGLTRLGTRQADPLSTVSRCYSADGRALSELTQ